MSISTEIDLLITNMIMFSRLDVSFSVEEAKNVKIEKTCQLTEYIDIALNNLVFLTTWYVLHKCIRSFQKQPAYSVILAYAVVNKTLIIGIILFVISCMP